MNLKELKTIVDFTIENLQPHQKPEEIQVLITLSESSIGSRAASGISYIGMGFDWEHGQLRIEPSKKLVSKGNSLNDVKKVVQKEFEHRKYYVCPRCLQKIAKDDYYCRYCGQKLS
ncbi:MAG: zinc ribbon domain-containing protein [Bacilli bacterium]